MAAIFLGLNVLTGKECSNVTVWTTDVPCNAMSRGARFSPQMAPMTKWGLLRNTAINSSTPSDAYKRQ